MRISWREVLGLLVGLAICYGVMSYAITNSLQNRETASEQTEASSERTVAKEQPPPTPPTTTPPPAPPSSNSGTRTVIIRVTGFGGEPFSGQMGTYGSTQPVTGTVLTDYELEVRTTPPPADSVFATIQKTAADDNLLTVQIVDAGKVVRGESTTSPNGVVNLTWSPDEQ